jgi:hypothetical protein
MHWMHMQNNRYECVQSYVYIYALDDVYAIIDPNMCNHMYTHMHWVHLQNNWYECVCNHMYTHIHWMHLQQSIRTCALKCIHIYIGCICKTIDTNVCNHTYTHMHWMHMQNNWYERVQSYVYTYALDAFAKQSIQMCAIIRIHWMRMQQSIQTCEIIRIHVFIGCMCNNRYIYTYALNMYAIIRMNVDVIWREWVYGGGWDQVQSLLVKKESSSILQVCSIMSEAIKSKKEPRFFCHSFGYYKKDFHHSLPYHSHVLMSKFLMRFGHSGSLSLYIWSLFPNSTFF